MLSQKACWKLGIIASLYPDNLPLIWCVTKVIYTEGDISLIIAYIS